MTKICKRSMGNCDHDPVRVALREVRAREEERTAARRRPQARSRPPMRMSKTTSRALVREARAAEAEGVVAAGPAAWRKEAGTMPRPEDTESLAGRASPELGSRQRTKRSPRSVPQPLP